MRTKKFGSGKDANRMLVRKLSGSFFLRGTLTTTVPRAKALRPFIEHMVHLAKKNTEGTKNVLLSKTGNKKLVAILTGQIAPVFSEKTSGFLRIIKLGSRASDGSQMGKLEWTLPVVVEAEEKKIKAKKELPKEGEISETIAKEKTQSVSKKKSVAKPAKKVTITK